MNAAGAVVADGNYNMRFKIYQDGDGASLGDTTGSPVGAIKWQELWQNSVATGSSAGVVVKNGYFSVNLGSFCGLTTNGSCQGTANAGVNFNWDTLWLSMDVGGTAVSNTPTYDGEMLPMRRLASAVYALQAASANTCTSCILQAPTSTAQNTISPNVNATAVTGLTVNGNTGTSGAATAVAVNQSQAADGVDIAVTKSDATTGTNGLSVAMTGSGTLSNGIQISRSAGTLSTGLLFSGAIGTEIKLQNNESIANSTNGTLTLASDSGALILNLSDQSTSATITNNTGNLILDSASNTLGIAANDTQIQRTASGNLTFDLSDAATTKLLVTNSGAGAGIVSAKTGFQINGGAATGGHYLRGDGTQYSDSTIQPADIPVCSGTCNYISNQTTQQSPGNFNILSGAAGSIGGQLQSAASGTAAVFVSKANTSSTGDLLELQDVNGMNLLRADVNGNQETLGSLNSPYGGIGIIGNLLLNSEALDNQAGSQPWARTGTLTITADNTAAPNGVTSAERIAGTGSTNITQTFTTTTAGTYTFSVWLKQSSGAATTGLCIFVTGGGTPNTCSATAVTPNSNTWQRFSVTTTVTSAVATVKVSILPGNGSTATIFGWGAQLQLSSAPGVYTRSSSDNNGFAQSTGLTSSGSILVPYDTTTSGNAAAIQVASLTSQLFTADTTNSRVTVGQVGQCAGGVGQGRLCIAQSTTGSGVNSNNTELVQTTSGTNTTYGSVIYVVDTSTGSTNTNYGLMVDSTRSTTASTQIGIQVNSKNTWAGNLLDLNNNVNDVLTVTNAGATTITGPSAGSGTALTVSSNAVSNVGLLVSQNTASATQPVAIIKGGATPGAGADLLQLQSSSSALLATFSQTGDLTIGASNPTHLFTDGFESGNMASWNLNGANGTTIDTAHVRTGREALKVAAAASTVNAFWTTPDNAAGYANMYLRGYFYATNNPSANDTVLFYFSDGQNGAGHEIQVVRSTTGLLGVKYGTAATNNSAQTMGLNGFHKIELTSNGLKNTAAGAYTLWYDGTSILTTSTANAGVASNLTEFQIGGDGNVTQTFWVDDLSVDSATPTTTDSASASVADTLNVGGNLNVGGPSAFSGPTTVNDQFFIGANNTSTTLSPNADLSMTATSSLMWGLYYNGSNETWRSGTLNGDIGVSMTPVSASGLRINVAQSTGTLAGQAVGGLEKTVALLTPTALELGAGSGAGSFANTGTLLFHNAGGTHTVGIQGPSSDPASSYTLTLPATGPGTSNCLQTDSTTATLLKFAACPGASIATLQQAYAASTGGTTAELVVPDTTRKGIDIQDRDTGSGGTIGATESLLAVRASAANGSLGASYLNVNASGKVG
ncbi:MAG TPA: hypothetical protein VHQ86_03605, partial [Candidatus Saccharimonadia bacterium]|nr:hypothetical protein [Candidatus Saccharimonadia bacterium]